MTNQELLTRFGLSFDALNGRWDNEAEAEILRRMDLSRAIIDLWDTTVFQYEQGTIETKEVADFINLVDGTIKPYRQTIKER